MTMPMVQLLPANRSLVAWESSAAIHLVTGRSH